MQSHLKDLERILAAVSRRKTAQFLKMLVAAPRVFIYGLGRSGLVARMFGMRLVHLGREATIVGDTTTPAIGSRDLLVICSRTGKSPFLHHAARLARRQGARVAAISGQRAAPHARDADFVLRIPIELARIETPQPLGSLFEQALLLYLDALVLKLMADLGKTPEDMERVHSNLP